MFLQKTIKNTILEKFLDQAWQGFLKYRCAGSKAAYREAKKNPDAVFQYDDPLLALLNHVLKESISKHHTDNDAAGSNSSCGRRPTSRSPSSTRTSTTGHGAKSTSAISSPPSPSTRIPRLSLEEEQNIRRWNGCSP